MARVQPLPPAWLGQGIELLLMMPCPCLLLHWLPAILTMAAAANSVSCSTSPTLQAEATPWQSAVRQTLPACCSQLQLATVAPCSPSSFLPPAAQVDSVTEWSPGLSQSRLFTVAVTAVPAGTWPCGPSTAASDKPQSSTCGKKQHSISPLTGSPGQDCLSKSVL